MSDLSAASYFTPTDQLPISARCLELQKSESEQHPRDATPKRALLAPILHAVADVIVSDDVLSGMIILADDGHSSYQTQPSAVPLPLPLLGVGFVNGYNRIRFRHDLCSFLSSLLSFWFNFFPDRLRRIPCDIRQIAAETPRMRGRQQCLRQLLAKSAALSYHTKMQAPPPDWRSRPVMTGLSRSGVMLSANHGGQGSSAALVGPGQTLQHERRGSHLVQSAPFYRLIRKKRSGRRRWYRPGVSRVSC